jgi:hypothetical protein
MNSQAKRLAPGALWVMALLVGVLAIWSPGFAQQATPSTRQGSPQFKQPAPARFTLTGLVMDGDVRLRLSGSGSQSGDRWQVDITGTPDQGSPSTASAVQIGQMYYYKSTRSPDWGELDLSQRPGQTPHIRTHPIRGLNLLNPTSQNYALAAITQTIQMGKQDINGVATT